MWALPEDPAILPPALKATSGGDSAGDGPGSTVTYTGGAASMFGEESWKWLLLQPLAGNGG